ncbi:MAG: class II aldolase family protein [Anaerolineae bacterium CG_4_9_14_3_um_filter_57_17]|nr:class II aldolase/adducin family protein [bacterium]NCT19956.1 class II aldolase/adducin family protein [bacterium]PJB68293.1 MAG: class II aldolase family protein [Anaerolineae bacterium CG_4_9_14_3_um_filter_57_17]
MFSNSPSANRIRFTSLATERDLRLAIVETGRLCYEQGLMPANNGNISVRMGADHILITPSTLCKGRLEPEDLLVIDLDGQVIKADPRRKRRISSETPMHLEAYHQRPDIRAIIHAHPAHATALTVAEIPFPEDVLPELLEGLGPVAVTGFATPSTSENADAIRGLIGAHDAVLIRNHGAITVGRDLEECLIHLERVEHVAKVVYMAHSLGHVSRLPVEIVEKLHALRQQMK